MLYYVSNYWMHPVASAIDFGEHLLGQKSNNGRYYFHCAIALDDSLKFEADGFELIGEYPIDPNETFDILRPRVPQEQIDNSLKYIQKFKNEKYGWLLDANDAIRAITGNKLSVSKDELENAERHMKVCSTLDLLYAIDLKLLDVESEDEIVITTPMSLFDQLKDKCEYVAYE